MSKQTPCIPVPVCLKEAFKEEVDKVLKAGIIKPVHEATPWINSFILIKGKDRLGNLKLHICLDQRNLNKAVVREPYHFKTAEDTAHLIAKSCVMTVCDCKKGYCHQELYEASSFLNTFNMELGRFQYTAMPYGITVTGDVFQQKLDQCLGHIENIIVIPDDIMVVGKKQNHRDHDTALTHLLETARRNNIHLNYDKLQYKKMEVNFVSETYTTSGQRPAQTKVSVITSMQEPSCKTQVQSFIGMVNHLSKFSPRLWELAEPVRELAKEGYHSTGAQSTKKCSTWSKKRFQVPWYWPTTTPENKWPFRQMQAAKGWVHAYYKRENWYTSQVGPHWSSKGYVGYVAIELESLMVPWKNFTISSMVITSY